MNRITFLGGAFVILVVAFVVVVLWSPAAAAQTGPDIISIAPVTHAVTGVTDSFLKEGILGTIIVALCVTVFFLVREIRSLYGQILSWATQVTKLASDSNGMATKTEATLSKTADALALVAPLGDIVKRATEQLIKSDLNSGRTEVLLARAVDRLDKAS